MPESLKAKHEVIISELKAQLDDLESFAYKQVCGKFVFYMLRYWYARWIGHTVRVMVIC